MDCGGEAGQYGPFSSSRLGPQSCTEIPNPKSSNLNTGPQPCSLQPFGEASCVSSPRVLCVGEHTVASLLSRVCHRRVSCVSLLSCLGVSSCVCCVSRDCLFCCLLCVIFRVLFVFLFVSALLPSTHTHTHTHTHTQVYAGKPVVAGDWLITKVSVCWSLCVGLSTCLPRHIL